MSVTCICLTTIEGGVTPEISNAPPNTAPEAAIARGEDMFTREICVWTVRVLKEDVRISIALLLGSQIASFSSRDRDRRMKYPRIYSRKMIFVHLSS
jgi:hypothetical protein